ncbi:MAG: DUF6273 domain-containing protein [Spirochaetaceae bacterium]|jgi:hypothetical protein|nr:DUF6273 domain-containing protein [Spirochaetaceae bacterium]
MSVGAIKIGDYVTLPSLSVAVYGGQGTAISGLASQKVKVVGINPYTDKNLNTPGAHLVFQFENIVTTRRMHSDANVSYGETELRRYLTPTGDTGSGNFYTGLVNAGVPADVFWAPMRVIGAKYGGAIESLQDKVFLPTFYEVDGTEFGGETSGNQGRLSAYHDENSRIKSGAGGIDWWWLASPYSGSSSGFCSVDISGYARYFNANSEGGLAPAFCIK